jgi:GT2 family glycosyltransferase
VLIPRQIADAVGNIDQGFAHSMGDIDYGLRARKLGFSIVAMPGYAGTCDRNSMDNTHYDTELGRMDRWKKITSNKELPMKSWYILSKRHTGLLWPIYWACPYIKVLLGKG